ncbi:ABC transporter ATP-binding protein [Vagococcus vulneris]|uniref:ATP-binding protein n=1 Tax=Vagococcus vulneris TaxID=1977869 RepID=A0A429ZV59_9ENTE|nr:ABC transporter ATP-binding protein [Vagococcus vulneris]RST97595.1 ATP-binding protein [Vagococcus vulneris]
MFSLLKYAAAYRKQLILGPFFKLLEAVFELLLPLCMAKLIDKGINQHNSHELIKYATLMLFMSVIGLGCVLICQYYAAVASQGFGTELRKHLMQKINQLSHSELDKLGTATLVTRMTSDINQLQLALAMFIRLVIRAPFLSIGSIIMAFYIDRQSAFVFLFILPVFSFILYTVMRKTVPLYKNVQQNIDSLNDDVDENLTGVRVIRAFAKTNSRETQFKTINQQVADAYIKVADWSSTLNPLTTLIMNTAVVFLLYFGGISVNSGRLLQGDVLALINYMTQMLLALIVVSNLVIIFTRAAASNQRVKEILDIKPIIETDNTNINHAPWTNPIIVDFSHVSFKYDTNGGYALNDITFSLPKGDTLGITGPTGSGKSTLINLIPKAYLVTHGQITVNGLPVNDYATGVLRSHIGIAPQTSQLFSGTIRSNLQMGLPEADDSTCLKALHIAQCDDFISQLPDGLDTIIEADGTNFSGGQKQRLTIARAVISQPDLVILDDSLSALDYKTDLALRQAIKQHLKTSSLIIISQRMSSIEHADQILVLNQGQEDGCGTHDELMKSSATYQQLVQSQAESANEGGQ